MTAADVDACAALVARTPLFAPYGYGAEEAAADLRGALDATERLTLLVAEAASAVVGFARFVHRGAFDRCGYLRLIVVDPDYTSGGVGKALMAALEVRYLRPTGIMLLCADDNTGAQRFYERLGYQQVGLVPDYVKPGLHERIYFKAAPRDMPAAEA